MNEIEEFLSNEITLNKKENWSKLDKTTRISRLNDFAIIYCEKNKLRSEEILTKLQDFLKTKLNQRRLISTKDVVYDLDRQVIASIPNLVFVNDNFVLNRNDKRTSTVKSLTPSKKN